MLAGISGVLGIVQILPYIRSILRGVTRPSRMASSIWVASNLITVASIAATGARAALVLPLAFTLTNLSTALLSIRYGISGLTRRDVLNGTVALAALTAWVLLGPRAAVIAMVVAQAAACLSVLDKLWRHPGTEDVLAWLLAGFASAFSVAAVIVEGDVDLAVLAVPAVSMVGFWAVAALGLLRKAPAPAGGPAPSDAESPVVEQAEDVAEDVLVPS